MKRVTLALLLLVPAACTPDPVLDRSRDALGPETAEGPGPLHRAGQPCGVCHQSGGAAESDFSVAGTVFSGGASKAAAEGARVILIDALGTSPPLEAPVVANAAGNFFVRRAVWSPTFPVSVRVESGRDARVMRSAIGGTASCADCHQAGAARDPLASVPPVFVGADGVDGKDGGAP